MTGDAIRLVTEALKARLEKALARYLMPGGVYVGTPDEGGAASAALVLFIYRIAPNPHLRNREHRVPGSPAPKVTVYANSLPLDLYYALTSGSGTTLSEEGRQKALGYAIQELQNDPVLTDTPLGPEAVRVTLEPLTTEESARIWALFPAVNYRTTVAYLASPVWIDPPKPAIEGAPVVDDTLRAGSRFEEMPV